MKSPYYKCYIGKRDITEYVESINYEDTTEEDNMVSFEIDQNYALKLADDDDFTTGKFISFQFGFMGGAISELHKCRVTDITHRYRERVTMSVKAMDLGTTVKKTTNQKIWKNKTSSQIAEEIAANYDMEVEVKTTSKVWANIPQGNKSDLDFLKYLASREDGGNYIVFIRNNTLYFVERGINESSKVTMTYGYGDGTLISFEPSTKESGQSPAGVKSSTTHIDPSTGKVDRVDVDNGSESKTGATESYRSFYGENGKLKEKVKGQLGKSNTSPTADKKEASNLANHSKKKSNLKTTTAKLVIEGNPLVIPNTVVTVKNVAKRHLGNWYIVKVTHAIKGQAYITTCDLNRNASKVKGKGATKADDANKSVGPSKNKEQVKVRVYKGENGAFVGYSSQSNTVKKK